MRMHDGDKRYIIKGSSPVVLPEGYIMKEISLYCKAITVDAEEAKKIHDLAQQTVLQQITNQVNMLLSYSGEKKKMIEQELRTRSSQIMDLRFIIEEKNELDLESRTAATFEELYNLLQDKEKITECVFPLLLSREGKQMFCQPGLRFSMGDASLPAGTVIYSPSVMTMETLDFALLDTYRKQFYRVELHDYNGYSALAQPLALFQQKAGNNLWIDFYNPDKRGDIKESDLLGGKFRSFCLGNDVVLYDLKTKSAKQLFHALATKTEQLAAFYRELASL